MKPRLLVIFVFLGLTACLIAQETELQSRYLEAQRRAIAAVESIYTAAQKVYATDPAFAPIDEFEKDVDYVNRVLDNFPRVKKLEFDPMLPYYKELHSICSQSLEIGGMDFTLESYDANNETYFLTCTYGEERYYLQLSLPPAKAKLLKQNWDTISKKCYASVYPNGRLVPNKIVINSTTHSINIEQELNQMVFIESLPKAYAIKPLLQYSAYLVFTGTGAVLYYPETDTMAKISREIYPYSFSASLDGSKFYTRAPYSLAYFFDFHAEELLYSEIWTNGGLFLSPDGTLGAHVIDNVAKLVTHRKHEALYRPLTLTYRGESRADWGYFIPGGVSQKLFKGLTWGDINTTNFARINDDYVDSDEGDSKGYINRDYSCVAVYEGSGYNSISLFNTATSIPKQVSIISDSTSFGWPAEDDQYYDDDRYYNPESWNVASMEFSPDCKQLAVLCRRHNSLDTLVSIIDVTTAKVLKIKHIPPVYNSFSFSMDGCHLICMTSYTENDVEGIFYVKIW